MRKASLLLLAAVSGNAAAEWVMHGENNASVVYYDPATIRNTGDTVKMQALFNLKKARVVDVLPYLSSKVQYEYDCRKERVRMLDTSLYSGNMAGGEVVYSIADPADWEIVAFDSVNEGLRKIACAKR